MFQVLRVNVTLRLPPTRLTVSVEIKPPYISPPQVKNTLILLARSLDLAIFRRHLAVRVNYKQLRFMSRQGRCDVQKGGRLDS